jgi:uncharacterized damage-inducible protein DinB
MDIAELLIELYGRVPPLAAGAADGLSPDQLRESPAPGTNSIGWLIWHLTRVQDHHLAELLDQPQVWVEGEWAPQFGLGPDPTNTGYGHDAAQVAAVQPETAAALLDYLDAVDLRTRHYLETLTPEDLDRVVDRRWDPPVTLGVRLVSVADDCLQHAGQAAYVRGLLQR